MFYLTETSALSNEANVLQFLKGALVVGLKNKNKQFVIQLSDRRSKIILHGFPSGFFAIAWQLSFSKFQLCQLIFYRTEVWRP